MKSYGGLKRGSCLPHLSVGGGDGQPVVRQRGREAGRDGRAGNAVGVDVLAVAPRRALVLQRALGFLRRRRRRLGGLRLARRLLRVGAEVCGVQAVTCGDKR